MEKLSRVKKYADLHESLSNDAESKLTSSDLNSFAQRLNRIDSNQFDAVEIREDSEHNPNHQARTVEVQEPIEEVVQEPVKATDTFNNEYLDEYIKEIKEYNLKKGYITSEKTSQHVFDSLKKMSTDQEFSQEVFDCIKTEVVLSKDGTIEEQKQVTEEVHARNEAITDEIAKLINETEEVDTLEEEKKKSKLRELFFIEDATLNSFDKVEETTEEVQQEQQKEVHEDHQETVEKTNYNVGIKERDYVNETSNSTLNTILVILILIVSVISVILIYRILTA